MTPVRQCRTVVSLDHRHSCPQSVVKQPEIQTARAFSHQREDFYPNFERTKDEDNLWSNWTCRKVCVLEEWWPGEYCGCMFFILSPYAEFLTPVTRDPPFWLSTNTIFNHFWPTNTRSKSFLGTCTLPHAFLALANILYSRLYPRAHSQPLLPVPSGKPPHSFKNLWKRSDTFSSTVNHFRALWHVQTHPQLSTTVPEPCNVPDLSFSSFCAFSTFYIRFRVSAHVFDTVHASLSLDVFANKSTRFPPFSAHFPPIFIDILFQSFYTTF